MLLLWKGEGRFVMSGLVLHTVEVKRSRAEQRLEGKSSSGLC
jgi:hypothetical protein